MHIWVLFLLWLRLFILSGVISPLISSSTLDTYQPGEFIFQCPIFLPFILFMGFSRKVYWSGFPFLSPVDHVLSELSTISRPSWVALHGPTGPLVTQWGRTSVSSLENSRGTSLFLVWFWFFEKKIFLINKRRIGETWKSPKCPLINEWIKKVGYIYTMESYSAMQRMK